MQNEIFYVAFDQVRWDFFFIDIILDDNIGWTWATNPLNTGRDVYAPVDYIFNSICTTFRKIISDIDLYENLFKRNLPWRNIFVNCCAIYYKARCQSWPVMKGLVFSTKNIFFLSKHTRFVSRIQDIGIIKYI